MEALGENARLRGEAWSNIGLSARYEIRGEGAVDEVTLVRVSLFA